MKIKIDRQWEFRRTGNDNSQWRLLDLPHDWAIEEDFDKSNCSARVIEEGHLEYRHDSYLPRGTGSYRKKLEIPVCYDHQQIFLEFEGVFGESILYADGKKVGENHSGYTGKIYDITALAAGKTSVEISMDVSAEKMQGWWYEGAGIYRHVHLIVKPACYILPWGIAVNTPEISGDHAKVALDIDIANALHETAGNISVKLFAPDGKIAAEKSITRQLSGNGSSSVSLEFMLDKIIRWDVESPQLYSAEVTLTTPGGSETEKVSFGIRELKFTPDQGFFLNGRHLQLRGGNIHHDFGGLGTALPDRAHEKNVEILKEMGCNIIRSSHNPAAPALMDACDRLGMLFWAETRNLHTDRGGVEDLTALIRRDRNHPSIILWGLANIAGAKNGNRSLTDKLQILHDTAKKLDPLRPTAVGLEGNADANANCFAMVTDVVGYNGGGIGIDDRDHEKFPDRCMIISEFASGRGARGIYKAEKISDAVETLGDGRVFPCDGCRATEQDLIHAHIKEWTHIIPRKHLAGGLMWSAIEYRGETCSWPIVTSQFGALDICRFPKDVFYYYQKLWTNQPVVHIFPPWNHDVPEGQMVEICCFSNCDYVEISLNGKIIPGFPQYLQQGSSFPYLNWRIPFEKGEIIAIGKKDGVEVCRQILRTPGKPAQLKISADREILKADGEDLSFLRIDLLDANGTFVPDGREKLHVSVSGAGKLRGICSGDPASHEKESASEMYTFSGSLLAIIQSSDTPGEISVEVTGEKMAPATLKLSVN